jgi:hypothetical protein
MASLNHLPRSTADRALLSRPIGVEAANRESFGKLLLFTLFFLTIVLDFRRVEGDENPFVMIMGIANLVLGAWYCVVYRNFTTLLYLWTSVFLLLVGLGTLTGIIYGQKIYFVLSQAVPVFSFLFAALAVHSIKGDVEKRNAIVIILATGFIAAAVKFAFGFYYYDLDRENVRYQIISGSIPLICAYGFAGILSRGRRFALLAILLAVVIVFISVTRTYIIVFGVSALICLYSYSNTSSRLFGSLVLVIAGSILMVTLTEVFPDILGRWSYRLLSSEHSFDLSAAYRLAEAQYQLQRLWSDLAGLLFGFGHAAETGLAGDNVRYIVSELGRRAIEDYHHLGYGDNFYVGLLYVGGLVAGLPVLVALFRLLWKGLRHARSRSMSPLDQFILIWGVSAFAGYLAYGVLAGSFGDRSISFFFGVSAGLVLLGLRSAPEVFDQVGRLGSDGRGDGRTPKQRRAAMALQAGTIPLTN